MQKYCSEECQAEAKRLRKKRQQELINGIEPIMDLQHQEYLTFSKAAILMGCTRQYIYKLVANGKLKASRLSSRMAFVRKADIEKMFEGNPYKRVVPVSKSKLSKKAKTEKPTQNQEPTKEKEDIEVLDYYSGEEVMSLYKVKKSWLYTSAKRNQIPMCRIAGKNYYSKRHIDEFFGTAVDIHCITEWVTADDVEEAFYLSNHQHTTHYNGNYSENGCGCKTAKPHNSCRIRHNYTGILQTNKGYEHSNAHRNCIAKVRWNAL